MPDSDPASMPHLSCRTPIRHPSWRALRRGRRHPAPAHTVAVSASLRLREASRPGDGAEIAAAGYHLPRRRVVVFQLRQACVRDAQSIRRVGTCAHHVRWLAMFWWAQVPTLPVLFERSGLRRAVSCATERSPTACRFEAKVYARMRICRGGGSGRGARRLSLRNDPSARPDTPRRSV